MSRLRILDDTASHICYDYIHGNFDSQTNQRIYDAVHEITDKISAPQYVFEIAYRIGYARSQLIDIVSKTAYNKKKKAIRDKILKVMEKKRGGVIKLGERDERYVACPYYLGIHSEAQRKKGQIRCEGVSKGNAISLVFCSEKDRKAHKVTFCYSIHGCRKCLIHQMLNKKYGVDDDI